MVFIPLETGKIILIQQENNKHFLLDVNSFCLSSCLKTKLK